MLTDGEGTDETPAEEYAMMLEVTMADCPGQPHPPAISWNVGMLMHILKCDPVLRELEHVQVGSPVYQEFYNRCEIIPGVSFRIRQYIMGNMYDIHL